MNIFLSIAHNFSLGQSSCQIHILFTGRFENNVSLVKRRVFQLHAYMCHTSQTIINCSEIHCIMNQILILTLNFLVAVVNTINTKTHSSTEIVEFSFENADAKSICYCKRMKSKLSLSSQCVETKLCKPCTSFT